MSFRVRTLLVLTACASVLVSIGLSVESFAQRRPARPEEVQAKLLNYYRLYPDRYISVVKHAWHVDSAKRTSYHSLTLKNSAGVAYGEIELRLNFQSTDGKVVDSRTVKVPGTIAPYQVLDVRRLAVKGARQEYDSVLASIAKASICR